MKRWRRQVRGLIRERWRHMVLVHMKKVATHVDIDVQLDNAGAACFFVDGIVLDQNHVHRQRHNPHRVVRHRPSYLQHKHHDDLRRRQQHRHPRQRGMGKRASEQKGKQDVGGEPRGTCNNRGAQIIIHDSCRLTPRVIAVAFPVAIPLLSLLAAL